MLKPLFKAVLPIAAIGLVTALSGCGSTNIEVNGEEGVPLAELDMSGDAPTEIALAGPDNVVITKGDTFSIDVEGDQDAVDALRFALSDRTLAIMREKDSWDSDGTATVRVTMPAPSEVLISGSGTMDVQSLTGDASINIGGSGKVNITSISAENLDINVGGSGDITGSGTVDQLNVNIGGAGDVGFSAVKVGNAEINIGGSGSVKFISDGNVEANILGSGNIIVAGNPTCTINAIGSGTLQCESPESEVPINEALDSDGSNVSGETNNES